MAQSDYVALVPHRLVQDSGERLLQLEPPFPVEGFAVGMVWHERSHGHRGQRWVREKLLGLQAAR